MSLMGLVLFDLVYSSVLLHYKLHIFNVSIFDKKISNQLQSQYVS